MYTFLKNILHIIFVYLSLKSGRLELLASIDLNI